MRVLPSTPILGEHPGQVAPLWRGSSVAYTPRWDVTSGLHGAEWQTLLACDLEIDCNDNEAFISRGRGSGIRREKFDLINLTKVPQDFFWRKLNRIELNLRSWSNLTWPVHTGPTSPRQSVGCSGFFDGHDWGDRSSTSTSSDPGTSCAYAYRP